MLSKEFCSGALLASCVLLCAATSVRVSSAPAMDTAKFAIKELETNFHEANTCADYELMFSLWADDAVFSSPAGTFVGPTEITDFLSSGPNWGAVTSLSSNYKALSRLRGNTADFVFECILVDVSGLDPLTTPLSTIPFGSQNPDVEIVQHSNATCTATRKKSGWVFQTFTGAAGPLRP